MGQQLTVLSQNIFVSSPFYIILKSSYMQLLLSILFLPYCLSQVTINLLTLGLKSDGSKCSQGQAICQPTLQCEQLYFELSDTCVQCPYHQENSKYGHTISCADCLENPLTWQYTRVCSYSYIQTQTYEEKQGAYQRVPMNPKQLYYIQTENAVTIVSICQGCDSFCLVQETSDSCFRSNEQDIKFAGITCQANYFADEGACSPCSTDCQQCSKQNTCEKCLPGSALNPATRVCVSCSKIDFCTSCYYVDDKDKQSYSLSDYPGDYENKMTISLRCNSCVSKTHEPMIPSLNMKSCVVCNIGCKRCEYTTYTRENPTKQEQYPTFYSMSYELKPTDYVLRCRQCEDQLTLHPNGEQCVTCDIKNCQYCYYSWEYKASTITTLDVGDFRVDSTAKVQLCKRCEDGYLLTSDYSECNENQASVLDAGKDCISVGSDTKCNACDKVFLDRATKQCLELKCASIFQYCEGCYKSSDGLTETCYKCQAGYFVDVISQGCQPCSENCSSCSQFTQVTNITQSILSSMPDINKDYVSKLNLDDFPIMDYQFCQACDEGAWETSSGYCSVCDASCESCSQSDGICMTCVMEVQLSLNKDQNSCIFCPDDCIACRERTDEEIMALNPSYNFQGDPRFTNLCFLMNSTNTGLFYDTSIGRPVSCGESIGKCRKYADLNINVYCSSEDYQSAKTASTDDSFTSLNIDLPYKYETSSQTTTIQNDFESDSTFQFWNQEALSQLTVTYQLKLPSDPSKRCEFSGATRFVSYAQAYVFSLRTLTIQLRPEDKYLDSKLTVQVGGDIIFTGIADLTIKALILKPKVDSKIKAYKIGFAENSFSKMKLESIEIGYYTDETLPPIYFTLQNVVSLQASDMKIYLMKYDSAMYASLFNFTFTQTLTMGFEVSISKLTFIQATFKGLSLFMTNIKHLRTQIWDFSEISFYDCFFDQANFLNETSNPFQVNEITITTMTLSGCNITQYSNFIDVPSANTLNIKLLNVESSYMISSKLINANFINLQESSFTGLTLDTNSFLITSQTSITLAKLDIGSSTFTKIVCLSVSCIINMNGLTQDLQATIASTTFQKITSNNIDEIDRISVASAFITLINYKRVSLTEVTVKNCYGLAVFNVQQTDVLTVTDSKCIVTDSDNKLPIFSTCARNKQSVNPSNVCFYVSSFTVAVKFKNLKVSGLMLLDSPAILITSYDTLERNTTRLKMDPELQEENPMLMELISFEGCSFTSNSLAILDQPQQVSLVVIISKQSQYIDLSGGSFEDNHLHQIESVTLNDAATCILIDSPKAQLCLSSLIFDGNRLTNGILGSIYIQVQFASLLGCTFQNANTFTEDWISSINGTDENTIKSRLLVISIGGHMNVRAKELLIEQSQFTAARASAAAGIYYYTTERGEVVIRDTTFSGLTAILENNDYSYGGGLFIDSNPQGSVELIMEKVIMTDCYARSDGGCLYITGQKKAFKITITESKFTNCLSLKGGIKLGYPPVLNYPSTTLDISNSRFSMDDRAFESFFGELSSITTLELKNFYDSISVIAFEGGEVTITMCSFSAIKYIGVLNLKEIVRISIGFTDFENISIYKQPLLGIINSDDQTITGSITLQSVHFYNISQFVPTTPDPDDCSQFYEADQYQPATFNEQCSGAEETEETDETTENGDASDSSGSDEQANESTNEREETDEDSSDAENDFQVDYRFFLCQLIDLEQITATLWGVIYIDSVTSQKKAVLETVSLENVVCAGCKNGLISIRNVDPQTKAKKTRILSINGLSCLQTQGGLFGCLSVVSDDDDQLEQIQKVGQTPKQTSRVLQSSLVRPEITFYLGYSNFQGNSATYGAGAYISGLTTLVEGAQFLNNNADIGGAIYYLTNGTPSIYLIDNSFISNLARIGAAFFLSSGGINDDPKFGNLFINNKAKEYGGNKVQFPRRLTVSLDGGKTILPTKNTYTPTSPTDTKAEQDEVLFENIYLPSGQEIGKYMFYDTIKDVRLALSRTFRVITLDENNLPTSNVLGTDSCQILGRVDGVGDYSKKNIVGNTNKFNGSQCNFDSMIIRLNPYQESYMELRIQCDNIKIPIYSQDNPILIDKYSSSYFLVMKVKTFQCQVGEFYDGTSCQLCTGNSYGVVAKQPTCSQFNNQTMVEVKDSTRINVRESYYRAFSHVDGAYIDLCYNSMTNCLGGWIPGDDSCAKGHCGALCESCDIYGRRTGTAYSHNGAYVCGRCDDATYNSLIITLISIWTLVSIALSVRSTSTMVLEYIRSLHLAKFGVVMNNQAGRLAVLLKILTNYFQIINSVASFRLSLPSFFSELTDNVGNPVKAMSYSMDCFLVDMTDIDILYFRMVWSMLMPFFYLVLFFILYGIVIHLKYAKYSVSVINTTFIYLFIYLQPTMIGGFMQLASYRTVSNYQWVQADVSNQYNTTTHQQWIGGFVTPFLILWAFLLPGYLFFQVFQQRHQLQTTMNRLKWGYFFNEYSRDSYYWEFVKILQKELIIIVLTYYDQAIIVKGIIVFLIVQMYGIFSYYHTPYSSTRMNQVDRINTFVCSVSIAIGLLIYACSEFDFYDLAILFWIIMGFLNFSFIIMMLMLIFQGYIEKAALMLDPYRDKFNDKYPGLQSRFPSLRIFLTNRTVMKARTQQLWVILRARLKQSIKARRLDKTVPIIPNLIPYEHQSFEKAATTNLKQTYPLDDSSQLVLKQDDQDEKQALSIHSQIEPIRRSRTKLASLTPRDQNQEHQGGLQQPESANQLIKLAEDCQSPPKSKAVSIHLSAQQPLQFEPQGIYIIQTKVDDNMPKESLKYD